MLLFSVLGSGVAGLRHYVKRDERRLNILHREKLLAAISLVRQSNSIEELDALQCEADEFLREALECYDDGAIEPAISPPMAWCSISSTTPWSTAAPRLPPWPPICPGADSISRYRRAS